MKNSFFIKKIKSSSWLIGLSLATIISCSTDEESIESTELLNATSTSFATPANKKIYTIRNRSNGRTMDIKDKSNSNGANLQVFGTDSNTRSTHRQWEVVSTGGKYVRLRGIDSGKSLEISNGSNSNGANAQQWAYQGTTHQQWELISTGSGYFRIKGRDSGKSLRVRGSSNGSNVDQASWDGGQNQQWFFTEVGSSSSGGNTGGTTTTPSTPSTGGSGSAAAIIGGMGSDWKLNAFSGSLNVGRGSYGRDGANGLDYEDRANTRDNNNWFFDTNGYAAFKCHVGNPSSNGSGNMRSELRELDGSGDEYEWNGSNNTNHRMRYKVQVRQLPSSGKVCFGQIHGLDDDIDDVIRVQLEDRSVDDGDRRSDTSGPGSGTYDVIIKGYVTETLDRDNRNTSMARMQMDREYDVEISMRNRVVTVRLDGRVIYTSNEVNSRDNYFKAGAYLQSAQEDKDPQLRRDSRNFGEVWIKDLTVNH